MKRDIQEINVITDIEYKKSTLLQHLKEATQIAYELRIPFKDFIEILRALYVGYAFENNNRSADPTTEFLNISRNTMFKIKRNALDVIENTTSIDYSNPNLKDTISQIFKVKNSFTIIELTELINSKTIEKKYEISDIEQILETLKDEGKLYIENNRYFTAIDFNKAELEKTKIKHKTKVQISEAIEIDISLQLPKWITELLENNS